MSHREDSAKLSGISIKKVYYLARRECLDSFVQAPSKYISHLHLLASDSKVGLAVQRKDLYQKIESDFVDMLLGLSRITCLSLSGLHIDNLTGTHSECCV